MTDTIPTYTHFGIVDYLDYIDEPEHQPGKAHCCSNYMMIVNSAVLYGFTSLEDAVVWRYSNHMRNITIIEDAQLAERVLRYLTELPAHEESQRRMAVLLDSVGSVVSKRVPLLDPTRS